MPITINAAPAEARTEADTSLVHALARNVIIYRARRKLSQAALAERAKLSRTTISNIERAQGDTTLVVLKLLSDALETTPDELLDARMPVEFASDEELDGLAATAHEDTVDAHALIVAIDEAAGYSAERYSRAGRPRVAR